MLYLQLNNILVYNTKLLIIKPNNYENKTFTPPKKIARLLLVIMICLPVWGSNAFAQTAESYVVLDNAAGTLTFKHDANKPAGAFSLNEICVYPAWYAGYGGSNENNIKRVIFDPSFANARPTICYAWFFGCNDLTVIEGLEYLNTENVTNMGEMFYYCSSLTSLDVSKFDTRNVTNMYEMFDGCSSLTSLDLSNFKTQNVTDMGWMFSYCVNLATIYASDKFVTTAYLLNGAMFKDCKKLVGAVPYDPNRVGKEMANYTTGYFTYKAASGIDAVSTTDNIAAEYYDVNGRRLNAPQKGINIVKRGNITTKVLVK